MSPEPGGDNEEMDSEQHESGTVQDPAMRSRYAERTRGLPIEDQWAQHQPLIKKLYVDERRPLWSVMEIMKRDFGFDVTAKMYKRRFKAWGYRKNIRLKQGEDQSVVQFLQKDAQYSEQSETQTRKIPLRNGQLVSKDRLVTYLRRREGRQANANTQLMTRVVKSPDTFYLSEAVLFQVRTYIRGEWEDTISTAEQLDTLREQHGASGEWNALAHGVRYALEQNKVNNALVLMRRAPSVLADFIEQRPVNMLYAFFMSLSYFTFEDLLDGPEAGQLLVVVKCLIKYAAVVVAKDQKLPSSHPIRQMLALLAQADEKEIYRLATKAWFVNCQSWDDLMDRPRSTYAIASWISYGEFNGFNALPPNLGNIIELTLDQNASKYGEYHMSSAIFKQQFHKYLKRPLTVATSRRTTHTLQMYSMYLTYRDTANGRNPYFNNEIVRVFEDLLRRGPQGLLKADALSWLARASKARGERESAERYMRNLIDFLLQDPVHRNSLARSFMNDLEMWFVEWGDTQKAAEQARWREEELGAEQTASVEQCLL